MSFELSFPAPEERQRLYSMVAGRTDRTDRPLQVFHKLLGAPQGLSGAELAKRLAPPVKESTVRQFAEQLRVILCREFLTGQCSSQAFLIEVDKNPYRLRFWHKDALKSNKDLGDRISKYKPSNLPTGDLGSLIDRAVSLGERLEAVRRTPR
jgi:hypothetical protein